MIDFFRKNVAASSLCDDRKSAVTFPQLCLPAILTTKYEEFYLWLAFLGPQPLATWIFLLHLLSTSKRWFTKATPSALLKE